MLFKKSALILSLLAFCFIWIGTSPQNARAQQKEQYQSVKDALSQAYKLRGSNGPRNINWIDGGDRYSYMAYNRRKDTNEIRAYNPANGEDQLIFDGQDLTFPDTDSAFTYRSFEWSKDSKYLVFQSNFRPVYRRSGISDYYYYSLQDHTLQRVAKDARTAQLSPDGQKIGYERDGDLFVYNLNTKKETRLTNSGMKDFYNGRFGWVYEEEFGMAQAWSWSPDSKHIAFWQTDERSVPIFKMTDYSGTHIDYEKIPYPQVGDTNPTVRIGTVNISNGDLKWMKVDLNGGYIPRIYWTSDPGELAIVHLNRPQNRLKLYFSDINTGKSKLIMQENRSEGWIDIFDFFAGVNDLFYFPKDRDQFFWISDRNGWNHIYRYNYDGKLINKVTDGKWEVTKVQDVDSDHNTIYFNATKESPLERHLYSIKFDGSDIQKLTSTPGRHHLSLSPNAKYYIDRYSNTETPTQVELWSTDGKMLKKLENNQSVTEFTKEHVYAPRELFSFTTTDGQKLDGYIIKPPDFDPNRKYPLFLNIYGGPGAQSVYNEFEDSGWMQYLAQEGYVIASVNNRGSGGYGRDFEKIVYKQLGKWESNDFVETAKFLAQKDYIDGDRMAIRGHSYGGYMTTFTMTTHPDVFAAGLVGAPVTDWRNYDSIYTERYMGLLQNNKEGYIQSSSTTHAKNLEGKMFIAHSTFDENVHVRNTMQFVKALTDAGIDADLRIYPPGAHGVAYNTASYYLLYTTYTKYLNRYLNKD